MDAVFLVLTVLFGGLFFFTFFRAVRFAKRHQDQLTGVVEKSSWWIRLFVKNGFGQEAERERKGLAMQWLIAAVLSFLVAGAAQFVYAPK